MACKVKPRYVPDLQDAAAVTTANFIKLQRLFPVSAQGQEKVISLVQQDKVIGSASFQVLERFSYTTTLLFHYRCHVLLSPQEYHVRVYDDACMAEVVLSESGRQLSGVYPYPNQNMYHQDEKQQLNRMLSEALSVCLSHGIGQIGCKVPKFM
jgi:uncharacterized protein YqiB (DUF1249 family)